jgi:tetratricopeptide (TPR) repeat protein
VDSVPSQTAPTAGRDERPPRVHRELNLRLLVITVVALFLVSAFGYGWYVLRSGKTAEAMKLRAEQLAEQEDWLAAAEHMRRYLSLRSDDESARLQMTGYYVKAADKDPAVMRQAIGVLHQTVGLIPGDLETRRHLVRLLYRSGNYSSVMQAATELLGESAGDPAALKFIALANYALLRLGGDVTVDAVRDAFENEAGPDQRALEGNVADVELASAAADFFATYAEEIAKAGNTSGSFEPSAAADSRDKADEILNELVRVSPNDPAAWMARYRFRMQKAANGLNEEQQQKWKTEALADLAKALEVDPKHRDALLADAALKMEAGAPSELADAEQSLKKLLEAAPESEAVYLQLSRVYELKNEPQSALGVLKDAARQLGRQGTSVRLRLAELYLANGNLDEIAGFWGAEEGGEDDVNLPAEVAELSLQLLPDEQARLESRLRLLQAGVHLAHGRPSLAIPFLEEAQQSAISRSEQPWAKEVQLRAMLLSAEAWTTLGAPERAAQQWLTIAELRPDLPFARLRAADQFLAAGLFGDAVDSYRAFLQLNAGVESSDAGPTADQVVAAQIGILRSHLGSQLVRAADQRNWVELESALGDAARNEELNNRCEFLFCELDYQFARLAESQADTAQPHKHQGAENTIAQITQRLQLAEDKFADKAEFWSGAAVAYQRLRHSVNAEEQEAKYGADVERALSRFEKVSNSPVQTAVLRSQLLAAGGDLHGAEAALSGVLGETRADERRALELRRLKIVAASGDVKRARQIAKDLLKPDEVDAGRELLLVAGELALADGDFDDCLAIEERLRDQTGARGIVWRFLRIQRMVAQFDKLRDADKRELASLVQGLSAERPRWYPGIAVAARHTELTGDLQRAIRGYELAVELGDRRLVTIERLARLLQHDGRIAQAIEVLKLVDSNSRQSDDRLLDALSISLVLQQEDVPGAIEVAARKAEEHPEDAERGLWYATLLAADKRFDDAEKYLRKLTETFPDDIRTWGGLFAFLVKTNKAGEARIVLPHLLETLANDPAKRDFVAGQCYEQLGDREQALAHYEQAVAKDSKQVLYLSRLAKLLVSTNLERAKTLYRQVVEMAPADQEAKRQLAILLATSGSESDWFEAEKLLRQGTATPLPADNRLRAILLARRGRNRAERIANCEAAEQIISRLIEDAVGPVPDADRLLLGGIYEELAVLAARLIDDEGQQRTRELERAQSLLERARSQFRELVNRGDASAQHLSMYIEFLMRHLQRKELLQTDSASSTMYASFLAEAKTRMAKLESMTASPDGLLPLDVFRLRLRLKQFEGNKSDLATDVQSYANRLLAKADTDAKRMQAYLVVGNLCSGLGMHDESEKAYRELMMLNPAGKLLVGSALAARGELEQAMALLLEARDGNQSAAVATILAHVFTSADYSSQQFDRVAPILDAAVRDNQSDLQLLMAVAVMHSERGENVKAIPLFEQILETDPDNVLALNNLATLLAEEPGRHEEASRYIDRAIAISGRKAALLDTQGTIFLLSGDVKRAVECLEEASAGIVHDPRVFLHLAAAYQGLGRLEDARSAIEYAVRQGITATILTESDNRLLSELQVALKSTQQVN